MKKTNDIKNNKGITMVSLIITIAVLFIISSITVYTSLDRFEINNYNKMKNDIELLSSKISNYYLQYKGLPVFRDAEKKMIKYTYTNLNFDKNKNDNENYYIIDLKAMEAISLNYGKNGFENPNTSDDVYIINEKSHQIYYVKGIELNGTVYYTVIDDEKNNITDIIPPSSPQIKVIYGTTDDNGTYITDVKIEIVHGKDSLSGIEKTIYSINNSPEEDISNLTNNIYTITEDGTYEIKARSYDKSKNITEYVSKTIVVKKTSIVLDKTEISLSIQSGATITTELVASLENVTKDLTWIASEDSGLIISGEGNTKTITATKAVENATITVSYGNVSTSCNVKVNEVEQVEVLNTTES